MTWRLIQASFSFLLVLQLPLLLLYKNTKYKYYYILLLLLYTLCFLLSLSLSLKLKQWAVLDPHRPNQTVSSLSLSLPTNLISFFPFQHLIFLPSICLPTNSLQGKPKTKFVFGCCSLSKFFDFVYKLFIFIFPDSYISLTCELLGSVHFFAFICF